MKALILNSGIGRRMGDLSSRKPKCMIEIKNNETILSRQLGFLEQCGVGKIVMTTGPFDEDLINYCLSLDSSLHFTFVNNPLYDQTNYIYSIYLAREKLNDDLLLIHGDLVFDLSVLQDALGQPASCMAISTIVPVPLKDFKAVIEKGLILKIGVDYFDNAVTAQPLYKINEEDWRVWLSSIRDYCEAGKVSCYAEDAFNEISDRCYLCPLDYKDRLCAEIDTPEDLNFIKKMISTEI